MPFRRFRERELRMICRVDKDGSESLLVGTAHFFPYSFRTSLCSLLKQARVVLFEGPLDEVSMAKVVEAGRYSVELSHFLDELDRRTVDVIAEAVKPRGPARRSLTSLQMLAPSTAGPAYDLVRGMKPWMAFFTIYSTFLENNGWKHSVDLEAYRIAKELGKEVVFLETIEEQIEVLEGLSRPKIIDFLARADQWPSYMREYVAWYLDGRLDRIAKNPFGFPTRDPWVIDRRDAILHERMAPHLAVGNAVAFVGVPHLVGITEMLAAEGHKCDGPVRLPLNIE